MIPRLPVLWVVAAILTVGCQGQSDRLTLEEAQEAYEISGDIIADLVCKEIDLEQEYKARPTPELKARHEAVKKQIDQECQRVKPLYKRLKELERKQ
jgi:hypothetical protein